MTTKPNLLIICGPTATGKTGLALELARRFNGELISCDSRQVYKYMDVVTGKDVPEKFRIQESEFRIKELAISFYTDGQIRIWGYDLVRPDQKFHLQLYLKFVKMVMLDIWERGKLPILVGGTGYYVRSLLEPPETVGVAVDEGLREELKGKGAEELLKVLKEVDPNKIDQMNESDRQNPRRLVRAIEVAENKKSEVRSQKSEDKDQELSPQILKSRKGTIAVQDDKSYLQIGLNMERQKLYGRIDERVEKRLLDKRLAEELEYLLKHEYLQHSPAVTIGYQQLIEWMGGLCSFEEMVQKWKFAEHGYARRQLTWFKKMKGIKWFNVDEEGWKKKATRVVEEWLEADS